MKHADTGWLDSKNESDYGKWLAQMSCGKGMFSDERAITVKNASYLVTQDEVRGSNGDCSVLVRLVKEESVLGAVRTDGGGMIADATKP